MHVEDMSAVKSSVGKPAMLTVFSLSAAIPTGTPVAWAMAASMSSAADQLCNCQMCCMPGRDRYSSSAETKKILCRIASIRKLCNFIYTLEELG